MRYRYLVDLWRGISVFAIFSYGIAVLGTPQCPPLYSAIFQNTKPLFCFAYRTLRLSEQKYQFVLKN